MPYIIIKAEEENKAIEKINARVQVVFSNEYYKSGKWRGKLEEIEVKLNAVFGEYLDYINSESMNNHHYNVFAPRQLFDKDNE